MAVLARTIAAAALAWAVAASAQPVVHPDVRLEIVSGDKQVVRAGATTEPFIVRVVDGQGRPVTGISIVFQSFCLPVDPITACVEQRSPFGTSDVLGLAASPPFTANGIAGASRVMARAVWQSDYPNAFALFDVATTDARGRLPSRLRVVSGDGQQVELGESTRPIVVQVLDDQGLPVEKTRVSIEAPCWVGPAVYPAPPPEPCMFWRGEWLRYAYHTDADGIAVSQVYWTNDVAGPIEVRARPDGGPWVPIVIQNVPPPKRAQVMSTRGDGPLVLQIDDASPRCAVDRLDTRSAKGIVPAMLAVPAGVVRATLRNCSSGEKVALSLHYPGAMPEGSRVWVSSPQWQPIATEPASAGVVRFSLVDGGPGDLDGEKNGRIVAEFGLGFGGPGDAAFEDLWWGGAAENGWGVSIVQRGDRLLPTLFAYDAAGRSTWYAMPAGRWNERGDTFTGELHAPRGKPLGAHDASQLVVGAPAGRAALAFTDAMNATLEVEIAGVATRKTLSRQFFGPMEAGSFARRAGMWWAGPSQNGWGLVLHQQYATLFVLVFTYREDGSPTWFALPSGYWSARDAYEGNVYRTTGTPWPGAYDASRLAFEQAGSASLRFSGEAATFDFNLAGRTGRYDLTPLLF